MKMQRIISLGLAVAVGCALAAPVRVEGQLLKKIQEAAERRIEARKAQADSAAMARVSRTIDSTLEKTGRGVGTVVNKATEVAEAALARSEQGVTAVASRLKGSGRAPDQLAANLLAGRAALPELRFEGNTDQFATSSASYIDRLARLLETQPGAFLIEGHVDPTGDVAADYALSEKRAATVKAELVAAGIPATRLFVMGLGSTRPGAPESAQAQAGAVAGGNARIEVARMQ